jgi:di/tricarboxylate transporter
VNLAWISVAALMIAILVSCTTQVNVGILCVAFAWIVGVYLGGMRVEEVAAGFPVQLFLTLSGVSLLFTQAQVNGTLDKIAHLAVRGCRGNVGFVPVGFFILAAALASAGPGNIATAAMLAPMAMSVAGRLGIPSFLMAIMVGNGANAGALSPLAPTGIIVNALMVRVGLGGLEWQTYRNNLGAHAAVALAGYLLFGGWRLFHLGSEQVAAAAAGVAGRDTQFTVRNWITLSVIACLICSALFLKLNVGMAAFAGAALLTLLRVADHDTPLRKMPWPVIIMVSGVTMLIALLEKTQGISLFADLIAKISTPRSVTGVVAFVTGSISAYSSTSGVVLPAFLPTVPSLVEKLGGGDPSAIASSMNVGAHLVDVSPLSTIGALCLASAAPGEEPRRLFLQLLAWGLSMTLVGAIACFLLFR